MRLATLLTPQGPRAVGVHRDAGSDRFVDLRAADPELPATLAGILALAGGLDRARAALAKGAASKEFVTGEILAPLPSPGKVFCIGLNYRDHAAESGAPVPERTGALQQVPQRLIVRPGVPIVLPRASATRSITRPSWWSSSAAGAAYSSASRRSRSMSAATAVGHDVSARDWQLNKPGKQWMAGKTPDTFGPPAPSSSRPTKSPTPCNLGIRLRLNGQTMQDSNTNSSFSASDV